MLRTRSLGTHTRPTSMRVAAAAVAAALASLAPAGPASAAAPRAGNQCKKREVGLVVGVLRCTAVAGPKYVWQRVTAKEPVGQPAATADCDPNYTPCVPIASDVDCSSGSGNGPAYVVGPVRVIGIDIYGLDHDGDGVGCERG